MAYDSCLNVSSSITHYGDGRGPIREGGVIINGPYRWKVRVDSVHNIVTANGPAKRTNYTIIDEEIDQDWVPGNDLC